mgnify:CR=1 FL=1
MKKSIKDIESVVSSHGCGQKKVLLSKEETSTNLTQVAVIYLKAGEEGKPHVHWGIEEGFFVLKGELDLLMGSEAVRMTAGDRCGIAHNRMQGECLVRNPATTRE